MQLCLRGSSTHFLECQGSETIGEVRERIASLETLKASEISLYAAGAPVSDDRLVSDFIDVDIELTVGLPGGKVHGSLARAGKVKGQTPKVEKQEKKKKKTGRAKRRIQYNRRFVNVVASFGRRRGPNSNSAPGS
ncbi:FAU ubiquitin-like and ribosomal protein S30 [Diorhabda carinulata]|uniref:FAU ubiquitin-like and ribosomal protein S30 n=1 Tax=Diorhabda sublineata TaxID=1163346 RepID=UPI0024E06F4B|nr:FAU ubiquitin-like and ribosomal protein S30 [Diorhabda sublineata]XP_057668605.1 FAU ubiquitin-like and ribosomal protein S30 [Diorhabda carinulata]